MPQLANYGNEIAATTLALQQLLTSAAPQVTARTLDAARRGVTGGSLNLMLYRDQLITYRSGNDPDPRGQLLAELHYLVTSFAADDADTDAQSQRAFGAARTAIENHPVLTVPVPDSTGGGAAGTTMHVRLQASAVPLGDLTSLWLASQAPFALSFGFTGTLPLLRERESGRVQLSVVTQVAGPGIIVVFSGPDAAAKSAAAASVARERGGAVATTSLGEVVSPHIGETEENLRRVFARAETASSVLFFDEADALFGPRTRVRSSHNRFANIDVDPILDLLAHAPGLVIVVVEEAGPELSRRAAVEVRFPPEEP